MLDREFVKPSKKPTLIKLRWLVIILISYLLLFGKLGVIKFIGIDTLIFIFLVSNILLYFLPDKYFASSFFDYFVILLDTAFIAWGIYLSGTGNLSFFVVFFLVILLSAFLGRVRELVIITVILGCIYVWFTTNFQLSSLTYWEKISIYLRVPFLLTIALFNSYLVKRVKSEKMRHQEAREDKKNLENILSISRSLLGTLETKKIVAEMIHEVSGIMGANRCSVILLDKERNKGRIIASIEKVAQKNMEISLANYPEIRKVLESGELVSIKSIKRDNLMNGVRSKLTSIPDQSVMALPIIIDADVMGTLFLRVTRSGQGFSKRDKDFCQVVANVTATALRNASLFESIRKESKKRKEAVRLLEEKNEELIKTKDYLENLITSSADAIVSTDTRGRVTYFSPGAEEIFGYKAEEVLGKNTSAYFAKGKNEFRKIVREIRHMSQIQNFETRLITKRGTRFFASISAAILNDVAKKPIGSVAIIKDITQRVELEREIREQARMISVINEVNNSFATTLDIEELCRIISAEMPKLLHYDEAGLFLMGSSDYDYLFSPLKNMEQDIFLPYLENENESLIQAIRESKNVMVKRDLGKEIEYKEEFDLLEKGVHSYLLAPLIAKQDVKGLLYFGSIMPNCFSPKDAEVVRQIGGQIVIAVENAMLHRKIKTQSVTDGLTGLYNHRYFHQRLEEEMQEAADRKRALSLLFLDLDFFKKFNDLNGHLLGDKALREVARILINCKGSQDVAARYGGEEFALICPEKDAAVAEKVSKKILSQIYSFPFQTKSGVYSINQLTISIGIASFPKDGGDRESLIAAADWALFLAKKRGRNQVQHSQTMDKREQSNAEADYSGVQK